MRYFVGDQIKLHDAMDEVWDRQKKTGKPRKTFSEIPWRGGKLKRRKTCIWTADSDTESLFRTVLQEKGITFEESNERVDPRKWRF